MGKNKNNTYFNMFVKSVDYSCQGAQMLHDTFAQFDISTIKEKMKEMHAIEHTADLLKHQMMKQLVQDFITPIDREDIIVLADAIDDLTDSIEDVMMHIFMYNIKHIRNEAHQFSSIIVKACNELKKILTEFSNFKKSKTIDNMIISVNGMEDEGDTLYSEAIRNLYTKCDNPVEIVAWTGLFERLEKCCDKCEDVADAVYSVIIQNT